MSLLLSPVSLHYARVKYSQEYDSIINICLELVLGEGIERLSVEYKQTEKSWQTLPTYKKETLSDRAELWGINDTPVILPILFRFRYQHGGKEYVDDNGKNYYLLSNKMLLGASRYVVPTCKVINNGSGEILIIELACRAENINRVECCIGDEFEFRLEMMSSHKNNNLVYYTLQQSVPFSVRQCVFRLYDHDGNSLNHTDDRVYRVSTMIY